MIDSTSEMILSLVQAADVLPRRRGGKKTHVSTLYRWATSGCRGIRLETIQVGGTCCTSREALQKFFEALTAAKAGVLIPVGVAPSPGRRTAACRLRESEKAGRELEELGA